MKILWITNVPSPYRVDFFRLLGLQVELTVLFEKAASSERDHSWTNYRFDTFEGIILEGASVDTDKAICFQVIKYISKGSYDHIVVSNMATPTGILAIEYMKLTRIPYFIEGDGGFYKTKKTLKEIIKPHIIKGAKGYLSTSKELDNYFIHYKAKKDRLIRYPFSSIHEDDVIPHILAVEEKNKIKYELGIQYEKLVVTIGQFIPRKGFDVLIRAAAALPKEVGIYIIGGKPTKEYELLMQKNKISNVTFIEFQPKEMLKQYFKAADLFVLPTREDIWGLVVNEAMAYGLPVITTTKCIAGLELVSPGWNGFLIPSENVKALTKSMNAILHNDDLREHMALHSLERIKDYTIESMVRRHIEVFEKFSNVKEV